MGNWQNQTLPTTWSGSGTASNPYKISSAKELALLAKKVNSGVVYSGKYFKQTKNISLSGYKWTAIGREYNDPYSFQGIYDGDGFIVSDMFLEANTVSQGLFGSVYGGTIKNLTLKNSFIFSEQDYTAGIVGTLDNGGSVINCHSKNVKIYTTNNADFYGGIVGQAWTNCLVDGCTFSGTVRASKNVGGILGFSHSAKVTNCYSNGQITATTDSAGGIVGYSDSGVTIEKCIAEVTVETNSHIGSIVGNCQSGGSVNNCAGFGLLLQNGSGPSGTIVGFFNGTLQNSFFIGGVVTEFAPFISGESTDYSMTSCYSYFNQQGYYSTSGDFSAFGIVEGMNEDLPMQKELYSIANMSTITGTAIRDFFSGAGFTRA